MELTEYLRVLKRRMWQIIMPAMIFGIVSTVVAVLVPPSYRSEATLSIERQEIPTELVETTVTGYVQERIRQLSQRLLVADTLWELAEKYDLYPEQRTEENRQEIVSMIRNNIAVETVDVRTNGGASGRPAMVTMAFKVSFDHNEAQTAQNVVNALARMFVEEHHRQRTHQAAQVSDFLDEEIIAMRTHIAELEQTIARFKEEHVNTMPDLANFNLRQREQSEEELARTEERIRALIDRKTALEAQLAITNPNKELFDDEGKRVQTGSERLQVLMAEYLKASSVYSPNHPDVIRLKREIEALDEGGSGSGEIANLVGQLTMMKSELFAARRRYSDRHPDVIRLRDSIARTERRLSALASRVQASRDPLGVVGDNPAYVSLKTQLDTLLANLKAEQDKKVELKQRMTEYEKRLSRTPEVEKNYLALSRDYDNAKRKYQELKDKQLKARMAEKLEAEARGEKFALIQPATLPAQPQSPNRLAIAFLGGFIGLLGGVGFASFAEYRDDTIRGSRDVVAVFGAPPLATIPVIVSSYRNS